MGLLSNIFGRKDKKLALPEAQEGSSDTRSTEFRKEMKQNNNDNSENRIYYSPRNFSVILKWKDWYNDEKSRNEYYKENKDAIYNGALSIVPVTANQNKIMCSYIDKDTRNSYQLELGKTTGNVHKGAMYEMDNIIALQFDYTLPEGVLTDEVKEHYDKLSKIKGLQLSKLGKKILSSTGIMPIVLSNITEDLYDKKIDFAEDKTKESVSQMPVVCNKADITGKSSEDIDNRMEDLYKYCKLAIDIGAFGNDDWQELDYIYASSKKQNIRRAPKYNRHAGLHKESYDKIKKEYFNANELNELTSKVREFQMEQKSAGEIDRMDIEEVAIFHMVKDVMTKLPLKYEDYILEYQKEHSNDKNYAEKIDLLNDMLNHSKIKFLEEKGLGKFVQVNKKQIHEKE